MTQLRLGDGVYVFEENYRVYERTADGRSTGGPIYREHFRFTTIAGETPRKWITDGGRQAFKKNPFETGFYTAEMVDENVWAKSNRYRIIDAIQQATTVQLRDIAKIIGYKESKGGESK